MRLDATEIDARERAKHTMTQSNRVLARSSATAEWPVLRTAANLEDILTYQALDCHLNDRNGDDGLRGILVRFRRGCLRNGNHAQGRQQARKLPTTETPPAEAATIHGSSVRS